MRLLVRVCGEGIEVVLLLEFPVRGEGLGCILVMVLASFATWFWVCEFDGCKLSVWKRDAGDTRVMRIEVKTSGT